MSDFTYRGVTVADTWPAGACRPGSQTRWQARRRVDGSQRWRCDLPSGEPFHAFTRAEALAAIRLSEEPPSRLVELQDALSELGLREA